jgi:hypothetical protein
MNRKDGGAVATAMEARANAQTVCIELGGGLVVEGKARGARAPGHAVVENKGAMAERTALALLLEFAPPKDESIL